MSKANNPMAIFKTEDNNIAVDVRLDDETVWLTQQQIAELFQSSRTNIVEHIKYIYEDGELDSEATCRDFRQVRIEGKRKVTRTLPHYNLDMILSVGYRVKSSTATQFRIWATGVLRQYLVTGAAINQRRLNQINQVIHILNRSSDEMVSGIANIVQQYSESLSLLENYDQQTLKVPKGTIDIRELGYAEARKLIEGMDYFRVSTLFGREKDDSFKSALATIYQTFEGQDLYPSVQEKAANLLYLIIKNHPFNDGNKRIAATMFVYFLSLNNALINNQGELLIASNTLAAITLMVALSKPEEKEMMCLLVVNMLQKDSHCIV